jgi:pimeloyl-ACP methyl ester carboxylesterase
VDLLKGEYKFIENAGHIIWWDKPKEYNDVILEFLDVEKERTTNYLKTNSK